MRKDTYVVYPSDVGWEDPVVDFGQGEFRYGPDCDGEWAPEEDEDGTPYTVFSFNLWDVDSVYEANRIADWAFALAKEVYETPAAYCPLDVWMNHVLSKGLQFDAETVPDVVKDFVGVVDGWSTVLYDSVNGNPNYSYLFKN